MTSCTNLPSNGYIKRWYPSLVWIDSTKNSSSAGICECSLCRATKGCKNCSSFSRLSGCLARASFCRKNWLKLELNGKRPPNQLGVKARPEELRSEEHTSELQSRENLVRRLLLEKK